MRTPSPSLRISAKRSRAVSNPTRTIDCGLLETSTPECAFSTSTTLHNVSVAYWPDKQGTDGSRCLPERVPCAGKCTSQRSSVLPIPTRKRARARQVFGNGPAVPGARSNRAGFASILMERAPRRDPVDLHKRPRSTTQKVFETKRDEAAASDSEAETADL